MSKSLFSNYSLGDLQLANRMVMAPLTRNRAGEGGIPTRMNAEYYQQRATAGLIITEASQVSAKGVGYPGTPGIYSDQQVEGWRSVTEAVHNEGGVIYIQLWYCGRISHPDLLGGEVPVAPSAIQPEGDAVTLEGMKPFITPRELEISEISNIVAEYRHAAEQAKFAGFDGIEVHAANGYLIDQFLRDDSNHRSDQYGGSKENRMRFLNEVLDAVSEIWPENRIGVRLSPENTFNSISDSDPANHFSYFISQLNKRELSYLHVLEGDMLNQSSALDYTALRSLFAGTYMANNGYTKDKAEQSLNADNSDLIAFGVPFLANPDLVARYQRDSVLNPVDSDAFYGGNEKGYTDYPFLDK